MTKCRRNFTIFSRTFPRDTSNRREQTYTRPILSLDRASILTFRRVRLRNRCPCLLSASVRIDVSIRGAAKFPSRVKSRWSTARSARFRRELYTEKRIRAVSGYGHCLLKIADRCRVQRNRVVSNLVHRNEWRVSGAAVHSSRHRLDSIADGAVPAK